MAEQNEPIMRDKIDDYLRKKMSPSERQSFENSISSEIKSNIELESLIVERLGVYEKRQEIKTWDFLEHKPTMMSRKLWVSVGIAACIVLGVFIIYPSVDNSTNEPILSSIDNRANPTQNTINAAHQGEINDEIVEKLDEEINFLIANSAFTVDFTKPTYTQSDSAKAVIEQIQLIQIKKIEYFISIKDRGHAETEYHDLLNWGPVNDSIVSKIKVIEHEAGF